MSYKKMRYYIIWLKNHTSRKDDEPIKVKAESIEDAKRIATLYLQNRFSFGSVYTLPEFKKWEPWWHIQFWGQKAINER